MQGPVSADVRVTEEVRVEQYHEHGPQPAWLPMWEYDTVEEARAALKLREPHLVTYRIVRREVGPWTSLPVTS